MLQNYGSFPVPKRINFPKAIVDAAGPQAPRVLLRLMREEPNEEIRWAIVTLFRTVVGRKGLPPVEAFDLSGGRAANVALAAWARQPTDPAAAMRLYRRCVEMEMLEPTQDGGAADFVFQALFRAAVAARDFDRAAGVFRAQYARRPASIEQPEGASNKLDDLFALHATFGPLAGFATDVAKHEGQLARPQVIYALGRLYERRLGQRLVADALYRAAYAVGIGGPEARDAASGFLATHAWDDLAIGELEAVAAAVDAESRSLYAANANLRLAFVYDRRGDDFKAAEHGQAALEMIRALSGQMTRTRGERRLQGPDAEKLAWAEVHWHYFRAARDKGDRAEMDKELASLLTFDPDDERIACDLIPALLERGRTEEAARLFVKPYATLRAMLDEKPDDPGLMNKLAWLCARSNQRLDEALALVTAAMRAVPDNHAILDTAAEVHFHLGHKAEAVALETKALSLKPGDPFLTAQLKRFREAAAEKPAR
jgi:hypothetical protein